MNVEDRVIRATFWKDRNLRKVSSESRLILLWLIAQADADGILELSSMAKESPVEKALIELSANGQVACYEAKDARWIWLPRMSGEQPSNGRLKVSRCSDRVPPPKPVVQGTLEKYYGREVSNTECKQACPRSFGQKRKSSGAATSDVQEVYNAWRDRQARPNACHLGPAARRTIESALKETKGERLITFIKYAYESDDSPARFWRGQNQQQRTYLGLDNLLQTGKLEGRLQAMEAYNSKHRSSGDKGLSSMGPMGAYRAHKRRVTKPAQPQPQKPTEAVTKPPSVMGGVGGEMIRLSRQCRTILALFEDRGDRGVTTSELAEIALKYSSRISDLRKAGHVIELVNRDRKGGNNLYILRSEASE
jgi:hypothetical protein